MSEVEWRTHAIELCVRLFRLGCRLTAVPFGFANLPQSLLILNESLIDFLAHNQFKFVEHVLVELANDELYGFLHSYGNLLIDSVVYVVEKLVDGVEVVVEKRLTQV